MRGRVVDGAWRPVWRAAILAVAALLVAAALPAEASDLKLKMVLNWKYQGPQGMFFLAEDLGYFKAAGLDMTIDQGNGSGAAVPLVLADGCT